MNCPICGAQLRAGEACPQCGFDVSCAYEKYPTLSLLIPGNSLEHHRQSWEAAQVPEGAFRCPKCGGAEFFCLPQRSRMICCRCRCELSYSVSIGKELERLRGQQEEEKARLDRLRAEADAAEQQVDQLRQTLTAQLHETLKNRVQSAGKLQSAQPQHSAQPQSSAPVQSSAPTQRKTTPVLAPPPTGAVLRRVAALDIPSVTSCTVRYGGDSAFAQALLPYCDEALAYRFAYETPVLELENAGGASQLGNREGYIFTSRAVYKYSVSGKPPKVQTVRFALRDIAAVRANDNSYGVFLVDKKGNHIGPIYANRAKSTNALANALTTLYKYLIAEYGGRG